MMRFTMKSAVVTCAWIMALGRGQAGLPRFNPGLGQAHRDVGACFPGPPAIIWFHAVKSIPWTRFARRCPAGCQPRDDLVHAPA